MGRKKEFTKIRKLLSGFKKNSLNNQASFILLTTNFDRNFEMKPQVKMSLGWLAAIPEVSLEYIFYGNMLSVKPGVLIEC